jgi:uncharacterized protein YjiK
MKEKHCFKIPLGILVTGTLFFFSPTVGATASYPPSYHRVVRTIETESFAEPHPAGLTYVADGAYFAYLPAAGTASPAAQTRMMAVGFAEDPQGTTSLPLDLNNPLNITFIPSAQKLFLFDDLNKELIEYTLGSDKRPQPASQRRLPVGHFGLVGAGGMTIDPASGDLFILDGDGRQILRIQPAAGQGQRGGEAYQSGQVSRIGLQGQPVTGLRGIAFNPADGHLYVLQPAGGRLFEFSLQGQVLSERDLSQIPLQDTQALVFAPSGDRTDDPANTSLYLTDSGLPDTRRSGQLIEISLDEPIVAAATFQSTLIRTIRTSQFNPPSPDTAGLAYHSSRGRLFFSDSEVNEMTIFTGVNYFEMTIGGSLVDSMSTLGFGSKEPTGLAYNATNGHLFVSDDDRRRIYEVNPGGDGLFDTSDDQVTSVDTTRFGSFDPEGIAFAAASRTLFIVDGVNNEVYLLRPGNNNVFDGVPPDGDDQVSQFDTAGFGMIDPEGAEYNDVTGVLYLVGHGNRNLLAEVATNGTLLQGIDISAANAVAPSGLALAPGSVNQQVFNIYIADRGIDNGANPNENDGKIYEMTLPSSGQDDTAPTVTAFDLPSTSSSLTVPILAFTATDNVGVTGYLATESATTPSAGAAGWSATAPTQHTFGAAGTRTLYGWAKDAAANVSASRSDTVTISTGSGDQLVAESRVAASSDDAEQSGSGSVSLASSDLELGADGGTSQTVGIRFANLGIPQGATIVDAYIQFTVDEVDSGATSVVIRGQAADNAATFTTGSGNITSRPVTGTSVSWSPVPWTQIGLAGADQRSPNLAPIIQEIVSRAGWASGNALVITIAGSGERTAESYNGSPSAAPLLHVAYQTGGGGGGGGDTTAPTVTAFDLPSTSSSLTVPILTFTATDNVGVTGYLATESATKPSAGAAGWSATAPTQYTFAAAGTRTLYGWAKDAAGNVSSSLSDTVVITLGTLHAGDLDGSVKVKGKSGKWEALVTVTVHNQNHSPVAGVFVSGTWSGAAGGTVSGTTDGTGSITFSSGNISGAATFGVSGMSLAGYNYAAGDNHDPDGDSNGTSITVNGP